MDGLEAKAFGRLPDDTVVYPGHADDTTLGTERPHLAEWRDRGWWATRPAMHADQRGTAVVSRVITAMGAADVWSLSRLWGASLRS